MEKSSPASAASLRWAILRRALRPSSSSPQSSSCGTVPFSSSDFLLNKKSLLLLESTPAHFWCSYADDSLQTEIERVSRKATRGFNLVPWEFSSWVEERILLTKRKDVCGNRDAVICYRLPIGRTPTLSLMWVLFFLVFDLSATTLARFLLLLVVELWRHPVTCLE